VGVAWYGDDESFQGFIDEHGLTFPQISDDAAVVFDRFDVPYQPAMAFVAADGSVELELGAVDEDEIAARIRALTG
jgi:hypothetical protein